MKAVWIFKNEEHEKEIQGKLMDMLVEDAINIYPSDQINALVKFGKAGLLNLE
ncbi:hypothetical protein psyc5s11_30370 [Clostridium gelidum]|uniref:Uncharacterized protein n=1 Tax=Clostridium gelidum TaxID=704125 RepID=A0ABM7T6I8_9CLOT|nr:hypothetical protein [Clostridium gelidum]BCZ46970.1 hypothetical protein psyc5s11_30370 [Clostridium gelidum]